MKNNTGEAILISAIIFCFLYFRPSEAWTNVGLLILMFFAICTWVMYDDEIGNRRNNLDIRRRELENRKLELEIKKLEKEDLK